MKQKHTGSSFEDFLREEGNLEETNRCAVTRIMPKLQMAPMKARTELPEWKPPTDLRHAATVISQLGRNMHEHAYLVGRTLLWVKEEVGHGEFLPWLESNVWFGHKTATSMMRFASRCDKEGATVEYHPGKCVTVTHLTNKAEPSAWDKLAEADGVLAHESRLTDVLRKEFDKWPSDRRADFFETVEMVLDELRRIRN